MAFAVNTTINSRSDLIASIRRMQATFGAPMCSNIDDQDIGRQIIKLQRYLSTIPDATQPSGFVFDPAQIRSYLADHSLPGAAMQLERAAQTYDITSLLYNWNSTSVSKLRSIPLSQHPIIAFMGDSTMEGVDETASPYNSQYSTGAMPRQLVPALASYGINAISQNAWGIAGANLNDYLIRNSWVTIAGGTVQGAGAVLGGVQFNFPSAGSTATWSVPGPVDTAQIYYFDGNNTRKIDYTVDGGATTTINLTTNAVIARTAPISLGSRGAHSITAGFGAASAGSVNVLGVDFWDSTVANYVKLWQFGAAGFQSANIINDTGAPAAGRLQQLRNFTPDVICLEMGPNDWRNSISVAAFKANMQTFITAVKGMPGPPEIWLFTPPYDNGTAGITAQQDLFVQAMYQLSDENNLLLIDLRKRWTSYAFAVAQGWMSGSDNIHPTKLGYGDQSYNILAKVVNYAISGQSPYA